VNSVEMAEQTDMVFGMGNHELGYFVLEGGPGPQKIRVLPP